MTDMNELQTDFETAVGYHFHGDLVPEHQPELEDEEAPVAAEEDSQVEDSSSSDEYVPTEAEKDAEEQAEAFQRRNAIASMAAFKAPTRITTGPKRVPPPPAKRDRSPAVVDDDSQPNLAEIFDLFDTPVKQRIAICRAYAQYLNAMLPKKKLKK